MNFREKFEAWHQRTYGYCTPPLLGFTALTAKYPATSQQQARWEGWQAQAVQPVAERAAA